MADKSSTDDILAKLRGEKKSAASEDSPVPAAAESSSAEPDSDKPAAKPAGKPAGTNDILAALRAEKAKPKGESAPAAAPKKAEPKKPATLPEGDKPSVEEMLKGLRGETSEKAAAPAAPTKPSMPPLPKKPAPTAKKKQPETRRNFLMAMFTVPIVAAWTMFCATTAAATLGLARFMMPNVLVEPPSTFKVGPPTDYPPGTVSTKWKAQFAVWLVHAEYEGQNLVYALSSVCTHLGCTPNWLEGEQKFKCPCHGSGFYITGVNFEGPAPRPLERHGIRVAPDGMLEVDKGQKFQQELGQWEDGNSKVEMV